MPRDGAQPMSSMPNHTLPGGKVHSESMNVSIFNLSGRKRGAKHPLLKQWLNITQSTSDSTQLRYTKTRRINTKQDVLIYVLTQATVANELGKVLALKVKILAHVHKSWYMTLMPASP